jgi:hypothetical protein
MQTEEAVGPISGIKEVRQPGRATRGGVKRLNLRLEHWFRHAEGPVERQRVRIAYQVDRAGGDDEVVRGVKVRPEKCLGAMSVVRNAGRGP